MTLDSSTQGQPALVLTNARIILPDEIVDGTVTVAGGLITSVDTGRTRVPGALDCEGDYLSPGLIELHTDNLERHLKPRPGVAWPEKAAVVAHDCELSSTGITTVFDALRVGSIVSDGRTNYAKYARDLCTAILRLRDADALKISHFIHLRAEICSETLTEELAEFGPDDRIGIVSVMDHTPGQRQFADMAQMRTYLSGKHAMSDRDVDTYMQFQIGVKARFGEEHEAAAVRRATELGVIMASHDDTTVDHVDRSHALGIGLAEFPTTMDAAKACRDRGISVMMGAPNIVRGGSHSGNVAAADLADAGLLDILSSDYVPFALLVAAVQVGERVGDLAKGLAMVTSAPAQAARLVDRGRISVGLRADLLRFNLGHGVAVPRGVWVKGRQVS